MCIVFRLISENLDHEIPYNCLSYYGLKNHNITINSYDMLDRQNNCIKNASLYFISINILLYTKIHRITNHKITLEKILKTCVCMQKIVRV